MSRVLIAGSGYVGSALGHALARGGDTVWGLRRHPGKSPRGIQPLAADLNDPETLRALPTGLDYVFYTAGAAEFSERAYRAAYVDGPRNLIDALQAQGQKPARVIFTSSTAVYAQEAGEWVDEDSPTAPQSFSGVAVLEGERLLSESGFQSVALRLAGIYGPGRTALIDRVRSGKARRERRARFLNLIHLDDIVAALAHLMRLDDPHPVYLGVDDEPQDYNALISWLAEQLGVPDPPFTGEPPSQRPFRNRRCRNTRLRASGYEFKHPSCRDGYRELLRKA